MNRPLVVLFRLSGDTLKSKVLMCVDLFCGAGGPHPLMKRASNKFGIAWIALNDNPGDEEGLEEVSGYISTALLADLFGVDQKKVAQDVIRFRAKHSRKNGTHLKAVPNLSEGI